MDGNGTGMIFMFLELGEFEVIIFLYFCLILKW